MGLDNLGQSPGGMASTILARIPYTATQFLPSLFSMFGTRNRDGYPPTHSPLLPAIILLAGVFYTAPGMG